VVEPLSPRVAGESYELPGAFHGNPDDRRIVATARVTNARLMTCDQRIFGCAARGQLTSLPARGGPPHAMIDFLTDLMQF